MEQKRKLSQKIFIVLAMLICWFAVIFDFIQATSNLLGISEYEMFSPWDYLSFMTVWTNVIIALVFTLALINKNWNISNFLNQPMVLSAIVVYIFVVGSSYHFMLANLWEPKGLRKVTDLLLHYFIPAIFFIYWLIYVKHGEVIFRRLYKFLYYPLIYAIYILIRGSLVQKYPYPFINVNELGYSTVLLTFLIFLVFYFLLSVLIWFIDWSLIKLKTMN